MLTSITQNTFSHPWLGVHSRLTDRFGANLEHLSEQEKYKLIATLALWRNFDLEIQAFGGSSVPLAEYVTKFSTIYEESDKVFSALEILATDCDESVTLNIIGAIANQLQSGVYVAA
jgi:hypothetical protein